jgi:anti-anti-sigma regulatory factor
MLKLNIDNIGEVAIVECEGRIVQSDAAFKLREVVTLQSDARTVVLDLSQVDAIEGGGLGMLVFLQRWAQDHDIRFKLFNPCRSVRERLKKVSSMSGSETFVHWDDGSTEQNVGASGYKVWIRLQRCVHPDRAALPFGHDDSSKDSPSPAAVTP